MIRKPAKDGLGNNGRDYIFNPAENKFEHKDDLIHESSSVVKPKDPKVGSPEHKLKNPQLYGYRHVPKIEQDLYPKLGTAPSEIAVAAYRLERDRQMTGSNGRYDKPKKKINAYAEVKIPIPKINFSLLRDPKREEREAALEKMRVSVFTSRPDPDRLRGIGSLANPTVKKLKAADWIKRNQTIYTDRGVEK